MAGVAHVRTLFQGARAPTPGLREPSARQSRCVRCDVARPTRPVGAAAVEVEEREALPFVTPDRGLLPSSADDVWSQADYAKLFWNYRTEEDYDVADVEGRLPLDLQGTFYRNGPGILELGGQAMHCFDGHGLIARVTIQGGEAHFRSRYVRTKVFEEEMAANQVLYRGFGSQKSGGALANLFDIRDKPVANTSLVEWAGRLFALWEAHNPFQLDPASLETLGEESFDGALREEQPFTAHPCYDCHTDRLVAFSNGIRHAEGKLHIWEIDRSCQIRQAVTHSVGLLPILYLHDFKVTKNWYIFHQAPLGLDAGNAFKYFLGACDQTQQVFFDKSKAGKLWLVPRNGGPPQTIETEPLMIWHYGNAFEDASGKIIIDACAMETFSFGSFDMRDPTSFPVSSVVRYEVDPKAQTAHKTTLLPQSADFPQTAPASQGDPSYRFLYLAAAANPGSSLPFRRVMKLDVETRRTDSWLAPEGCFIGEPIYAPRTSTASDRSSLERAFSGASGGSPSLPEDDGYILCLMADTKAERSSLLVFEAADVQAGPICKLNLRQMLPLAFHCAWSQTAFK